MKLVSIFSIIIREYNSNKLDYIDLAIGGDLMKKYRFKLILNIIGLLVCIGGLFVKSSTSYYILCLFCSISFTISIWKTTKTNKETNINSKR